MALNRTSLAAVKVPVKGTISIDICVFYQEPNGQIKEASFASATNWTTNPDDIVGTGKLNTGIAAVCWTGDDGNPNFRVYFLDADNTITQRVRSGASGPWTDGPMTKFQAAPYSKLAAVTTSDSSPNIKLFFQDPTNKLKEILGTGDAAWKEGPNTLPIAFPGTCIAAAVDNTTITTTDRIGLYYQDVDLTLKEYMFNKSTWKAGSLQTTRVFPPGASVSSTLYFTQGSRPHKHVAAVDENNQLCITPQDVDWASTFDVGQRAITLSPVVIIALRTIDDMRLFYQTEDGTIAELTSSEGNSWDVVTANILG